MSLSYKHQESRVLFGSKDESDSRTAVALTADYADNVKAIESAGFSKVNLDILYTVGASETDNSIEIKVEGSPDGTNWYRIPNDDTNGSTSTLTAREFTFAGADGAASSISIGLDIFYQNIRVSIKETGAVTNAGTAFVEATLSE